MKKKLITGVLATLACLTCFTACDALDNLLKPVNPQESSSTVDSSDDSSVDNSGTSSSDDSSSTVTDAIDLEEVKAYADEYFRAENASTRADYELPHSLSYDVYSLPLSWSVNVTEGVTVDRQADKTIIDVNENLAEDLKYTLTLTITHPEDATKTVTVNFNRTVLKAPTLVPAKITKAPVEEKAYKLHIYHAQLQADYYMTGNIYKTYEYYFDISTDFSKAVDVYVEAVENEEGKFYMYHNGTDTAPGKKYINARKTSDGQHISNYFEDTAETKWSFDAEIGTMVTVINDLEGNDTKFYLGCDTDPSHKSISPQSTSENKGYLIEMVDRTEIPASDKIAQTKKELSLPAVYVGAGELTLATMGVTFPDATIAWEIVSGSSATVTDGKLVITAPTAATTVVLKATISNGTATPDTKEMSVKLIPNESVAILDALFALNSGESFANNVTLTGIVSAFSYNGTYNETYGNISVEMMVAYGNEYKTVGCFRLKSDGTSGVSESAITVGDTLTVTGILTNYNDGTFQFDKECTYSTVVNGDETDVPGYVAPQPNPELITDAYKFVINAKGEDETFEDYFVQATVSGKFLMTTTSAALGADVYAEKVDGSYKFYFKTEEGGKNYITATANSGDSSATLALATETTTVFDYDHTFNCWYTTINDTEYYLGTYSNWTTLGASKKSFITSANIGVSQYVATLKLSSEFEVEEGATDEEQVAETLKEIKDLGTVYVGNTTVTLPTKGTAYETVAINWAVVGDGATYSDGTLTFNPTATGTVTVTATVVSGDVTDSTKVFTVKLVPNNAADIVNAVYDLDDGEAIANKVSLSGVITKVDTAYSAEKQYITVTIKVTGADASKTIQCYRLKDGTVTAVANLAAGDNITVNGTLKNYYNSYNQTNTFEFDSGCTLEAYEKAAFTQTTLADAIATDAANYSNPIEVTATIVNVESASDKSFVKMTIADEIGNTLYVYGANAGALTDATIAVGATVTLQGTLSSYKGQIQFNKPKATELTAPTGELSDTHKAIAAAMELSVNDTIVASGAENVAIANANYAGVTISWASDKNFAVVDNTNGTVTYTLQAEATEVTLTATVVAGTAQKLVTFTVNLAVKPEEGTAVVAYTFIADTTTSSWADAAAVSVPVSGVTIVFNTDKNDATTAASFSASDYLRLYQMSADDKTAGGSITIAVEGKKIASIKVTVAAKMGAHAFTNATCDDDTKTEFILKATDTVNGVDSITITNMSGKTEKIRIDIKSIEITYYT